MSWVKGFRVTKLLKGVSRYNFNSILACYESSSSLSNEVSTVMPDEAYTPEHKELQRSLRKIIEKDINPNVDKWEEDQIFPAHELYKKLGNAGLLGISRPTEYGGLGLDYTYSLAFLSELGNINCGGVPMAVMVHTECTTPVLAQFGSDELKKEFLAPSISGDRVSCLGISEVQGGSDVANIKTTAVRKGDDLVINGGKMWTTTGCQADWMCLLANTREGPFHKNKSLICLPMNLPGITVSQKIKKIGMHSSDTAQIFFEDVRVPAKNIIGEEGMGFQYQMAQFQDERLAGATIASTQLTRMLHETIEYCKQRKAFGQPILNNQYIHFQLAELQTEVELLKSLIYRAVVERLNKKDITYLTTVAKLKAGRLARELNDKCLQFWGGMGYTNEVIVSRFYRDTRLLSIGGGTDEVMLSIICKYMGILPKLPETKKIK